MEPVYRRVRAHPWLADAALAVLLMAVSAAAYGRQPGAVPVAAAMAGCGLSNTEIAAVLSISETTVKTHISHIMAKLALRDRVQIVVYAYETGLVTPQGRPG